MEAEENVLWKAARLYREGNLTWITRHVLRRTGREGRTGDYEGCLLGALEVGTNGFPKIHVGSTTGEHNAPKGTYGTLAATILELAPCRCFEGCSAPDAWQIITHYNDIHCFDALQAAEILEKAAVRLDEVI